MLTGVIGGLIAPVNPAYQYVLIDESTAEAFIKLQDKLLERWVKESEFPLRSLPVIYTFDKDTKNETN